jgi:hypothetical protein
MIQIKDKTFTYKKMKMNTCVQENFTYIMEKIRTSPTKPGIKNKNKCFIMA